MPPLLRPLAPVPHRSASTIATRIDGILLAQSDRGPQAGKAATDDAHVDVARAAQSIDWFCGVARERFVNPDRAHPLARRRLAPRTKRKFDVFCSGTQTPCPFAFRQFLLLLSATRPGGSPCRTVRASSRSPKGGRPAAHRQVSESPASLSESSYRASGRSYTQA